MEVLSEDKIKKWILPHLSKGNRGEKPKVSLICIVKAILYKLKSGCQWRQLPVRTFFDRDSISWQGVYHHFRKWSKDNSWRSVWVELLKDNRQFLDLSSVQLVGSHTLAKNGGEAIGYQGRKGARSSNSLFLVDNQGVLLCCSTAEAGNHHDLFEIKEVFEQMYELLREAGISLDGVFLNADAGFDSKEFRDICKKEKIEANIPANKRNSVQIENDIYFDELLYKRRTLAEQANTWLDSFKTLLVRFEVKVKHWIAFHFMAFAILFIRKLTNLRKL